MWCEKCFNSALDSFFIKKKSLKFIKLFFKICNVINSLSLSLSLSLYIYIVIYSYSANFLYKWVLGRELLRKSIKNTLIYIFGHYSKLKSIYFKLMSLDPLRYINYTHFFFPHCVTQHSHVYSQQIFQSCESLFNIDLIFPRTSSFTNPWVSQVQELHQLWVVKCNFAQRSKPNPSRPRHWFKHKLTITQIPIVIKRIT
jgi:hypothetical protein